MDGDRSARALARIDAALARIEAASAQTDAPAGGAELATVQARHNRLRAAVQDALSQLDRLIESPPG